MRAMTYRIELDREHGYVISNADASWESLPVRDSFNHPPIKVSNAPLDGKWLVGNMDDYVELSGSDDGTFQEEYLKALHGGSDVWCLIAVSIDHIGATLLFGNKETHDTEFLYIHHANYLRVWFDVYRESGSFDRYLFTMSEDVRDEKTYSDVRITEYSPSTRREIAFNRGVSYDAECPDPHYVYAYVTEYR